MRLNFGLGLTDLRSGAGIRPDLSIVAKYQALGAQAFLHDFSRTDRTFQDRYGVTAADDAGEAVALAMSIDQIGTQTLAQLVASQPELLLNPDFAIDVANWDTPVSAYTTVTWSDGRLRVTRTGAGNYPIARQTVVVPNNTNFYRLAVQSFNPSARNARFQFGFNIDANVSTAAAADLVRYAQVPSLSGLTGNVEIGFEGASGSPGEFIEFDNISMKLIPGNHAAQPGSTSLRALRQADGSLKPDGLDDNLISVLSSTTSMFFAAAIKGGANPGSGVGTIIGGPIGTARGFMGRDTSGRLCAGVGSDSTGTIVGGSDLAGATGVAMLNIDAAGNVDLEWMPKGGALTSLYSAPINGAVGAGTPLRLWATNASGSAANYCSDYTYLALAQQAKWTAGERAQLATFWNSRLP